MNTDENKNTIEGNTNEYRNAYGYTNTLQAAINSVPFIETPKKSNIDTEYQTVLNKMEESITSETKDLTQNLRGLVNNINNEQLVDEMIEKMANGIDVLNENPNTNDYSNRTLGMINSKILLFLSVLLIIILILAYVLIIKKI